MFFTVSRPVNLYPIPQQFQHSAWSMAHSESITYTIYIISVPTVVKKTP